MVKLDKVIFRNDIFSNLSVRIKIIQFVYNESI